MSLYSHNDDGDNLSSKQPTSCLLSAKIDVPLDKSMKTTTPSSGIHEMEIKSVSKSQLSTLKPTSSIESNMAEISLRTGDIGCSEPRSRQWSASTSVSLRSHGTIPPGSPLSKYRSIPQSRLSFTKSRPMTNFEREFFSDDYLSGNEDDGYECYASDYASVDLMTIVVSPDSLVYAGVCRFKDFIRSLPVHLSKFILGMLDKNSLTNCLCISKHWRILAEEVRQDCLVHQLMTEEVMLMQVNLKRSRKHNYSI